MGVFDAFLGSLFIGHTVATALWGVTCVQTWTYFTQSKGSQQDPKWMRAMVIAIWVFDTIHEIIIAKSVYDYCVTFFAQPKLLESIPNGAWVQVFLVQITALLVHGFYIFRIWRLSKRNWFFTGPVLLITVAELVAACFDIRAVAISDSWPSILQHTRHFTTLLNALMFTVDISISAVMCYLLARNNSEYERTRSIVKRIMVFTLSTNLITSICAMLVLITAAVYPEKIIFMPFFIVTSRLYANSIMAALNMRPYLKRGVTNHATTEDSIQLPMWHSASGGTRVGQSAVKTQTTTWNEGEQTMKTMDDPMSPGPYMNVNVHVEKHTRV